MDLKKPYTKPYQTLPQQIALLKSRGMTIDDEAKAEHYLRTIGYYRLSGYWFPFRKREAADAATITDDFVEGADFHKAVDLYVFDRKLRLLMLDAIERIEVALRVEIAVMLGGRDAWAHRKAQFLHADFVHGKKCKPHSEWLKKLDEYTMRSREHFVLSYNHKYRDQLPIWIAIEVWDFGMMSHFLNGMKDKDKEAIANRYGLPRRDLLTTWMKSINFARNVCAHHARLWNISPADQPKLPKAGEVAELEHLIGDKEAQTRVYAVIAVTQYFLKRINPTSSWHERLKTLMAQLPEAPGVGPRQMGFPDKWNDLDLWR